MASHTNVKLAIGLLVAQVILGGYTVIGKFGIKEIDPVLFALIRELSAAPILVFLAYWIEWCPSSSKRPHGLPTIDIPAQTSANFPSWSDFPSFVLLAVTGIFGNQLFFILGLSRSSSITAAIIQPAAPIWTVIFALALRIEVLSRMKIIGISIAVFGSLITLGVFNLSFETFNSGSIFFVLNTACMGGYFLLQKPILKKFPPITTTAFAYVIGASMMAIATMCFSAAGHIKPLTWISFTKALWPLIYTILGPSIGTYVFLAYANQKFDSTVVSASKTLQPLSASVLAYLLLGERLLPQHALGAVFLIAGMLILVKDSSKNMGVSSTKDHNT